MPSLKQYQAVKSKDQTYRSSLSVTEPATAINFWDRLIRYDVHESVLDHIDATDGRGTLCNAPILAMPTEIILDITSNLDRGDLLNLAMTCPHLLNVALRIISTDIYATSGSWSGQPIATIGSYLTSLPPPFFEDGFAYKAAEREDLID